jgi:hypothetical protein
MDQDRLIAIVQRAGIRYQKPVTLQTSYSFVRFTLGAARRSLNLGFNATDGHFVADFVFKGKSKEENQADMNTFMAIFGGTVGERPTAFARLLPSLAEEAKLIEAIKAYWVMK